MTHDALVEELEFIRGHLAEAATKSERSRENTLKTMRKNACMFVGQLADDPEARRVALASDDADLREAATLAATDRPGMSEWTWLPKLPAKPRPEVPPVALPPEWQAKLDAAMGVIRESMPKLQAIKANEATPEGRERNWAEMMTSLGATASAPQTKATAEVERLVTFSRANWEGAVSEAAALPKEQLEAIADAAWNAEIRARAVVLAAVARVRKGEVLPIMWHTTVLVDLAEGGNREGALEDITQLVALRGEAQYRALERLVETLRQIADRDA